MTIPVHKEFPPAIGWLVVRYITERRCTGVSGAYVGASPGVTGQRWVKRNAGLGQMVQRALQCLDILLELVLQTRELGLEP